MTDTANSFGVQIMTEGFFYSGAVLALRKAGQQTYGTQELWLLEDIKDAQAAVGAEVEYQGWTNVTILQEPLPPFGLERPLPTITEDTGEVECLGEKRRGGLLLMCSVSRCVLYSCWG